MGSASERTRCVSTGVLTDGRVGASADADPSRRASASTREPARSADAASLAAELAGGSVWLSATVEAEPLSGPARTAADGLSDWRIVVSAPLAVDNQLPLRGSLLVWERPKVGPLAAC